MATDPRGLRDIAPLLDAWVRFQETSGHPFTIPGHKHDRSLVGDVIAGDVPLYAGLDTMKLTSGVLQSAEVLAASAWGADRAIFSVGGSTHANQTLALSCGQPGDRVVVARNAHRSLVLGLVLAGLEPVWISPGVDTKTAVPLPISTTDLAEKLDRSGAVAAHVTDPSYLGTHGGLPELAAVAHSRDVPLLVDAAWAAHFGFHPDLPSNAITAGADAMVTSAHKCLPAYSQAALVLTLGERLPSERLAMAAEATATTSPSGAILASIDAARALLERDGVALLGTSLSAVARLRRELRSIPGLTVLDGPNVDPLKVTCLLAGTGADGNLVEHDLLAQGLPVELADRDTLVALVTLADSPDDLTLLGERLTASIERHRGEPRSPVPGAAYRIAPEVAVLPREAFFAAREAVSFEAALGRVSAELIAPYPPGIPVLAPGERVTTEVCDALSAARSAGVRIAYAADPSLSTLQVIS